MTFSVMLSACGVVQSSANQLNCGPDSSVSGPCPIQVQEPGDFNYQTRQEILQRRIQCLLMVPSLVSGEYTPSSDVFGQIQNGRPWWGMRGESVWGPGRRAPEGPAEESRFLLNPYLLVGANSCTAELWKPDKIEEADLSDRQFPFFWLPDSITIWPEKSLEQVVYKVDQFNQQMDLRRSKLKEEVIYPYFGLIAYNARDFGYDYIYLDVDASRNIKNAGSKEKEPVKIEQMIHCGGSCKVPGGCNNMSPKMPAIDKIEYTSLPAQVTIKLWKQKPEGVASPADFTVIFELH